MLVASHLRRPGQTPRRPNRVGVSAMPEKPPRAGKETIPVARPATVAPPIDLPEGEEERPVQSWIEFSRESLRGWSTSLTLHGLILVALALWIIVPKSNPPKVFSTRLAGSENGVEEGMNRTGGLNTQSEMTITPEPTPAPALTGLKPLDMAALEVKAPEIVGSSKASAGGGMNNNNPGAGDGDGFGLAKFGQGGESVRGVEVKVGDPQFTLLWDTEVDLDLHVIEPGGKEIHWEDPKGTFGGELDVDNTKGFGPENIYWMHLVEGTDERVKGQGPTGEYKWFVVYWGGFGGIPKPTKWKVRIKHGDKATVVTGRFKSLNERSKTYTLKVDPPVAGTSAANATP